MGGVYEEQLVTRYIQMGMRMILSGVDLGSLMTAATLLAQSESGCLAESGFDPVSPYDFKLIHACFHCWTNS